jgi:hypothetical protein
MIERTDGVAAPINISHGMALQINSPRSELVKAAVSRRDL